MGLKGLLQPKTVAVIGASEKEGFGGDTSRNVISLMEKGRYYFVNPKRTEVFGQKCYPSVTDIDDNIELAIVCTPQKTVIPILKEALPKGLKGAVVFASGYSEVGDEVGKENERELLEFCKENDIALMGPNCAGFINYIDGVSSFAFLSSERDRKGSVAFISQSGQLVLSAMDRPGTHYSYVISAGNANVVTMESYIDFLVEDPDTRVISIYVEGINNPEDLIKALEKASIKRKPIVMLKAGRSEKAQEIAASHTGSMSGSDAVVDAVLEKYGVIRVDDFEELVSTAQALSVLAKLPESDGFTSISLSGGETAICADLGEEFALNYRDLKPETLEALNNMLPDYATPNNPLDITATLSYDTEKFAAALEVLMKDPNVALISVGYTLLQEITDNAIEYMYEAMKLVSGKSWSKPMLMLPFVEMSRNEYYVEKLQECNVPVLPTSRYAFKIISNIFNYAKYDRERLRFPKTVSTQIKGKETVSLSEAESKQFLMDCGLHIDEFKVAKSKEEVISYFEEIQKSSPDAAVPVALKIDSRDILHKTEASGVKLGLADKESVGKAYDDILASAKAYNPNARINGVQITEMLKPGVEVIIGVKNDPDFGPVILCGLGGILVEVFKDVSLKLAPVSKSEAMDMISNLKAKVILEGYRGKEKCDLESLYELIVKVSDIADKNRDRILELDMNPVFMTSEGATIADALVIISEES